MLLIRLFAFALMAAGIAIVPAAAAPTLGPGPSAGQLLHLAHAPYGWHRDCIDGHRHLPNGVAVPCLGEDDDDDGPDDGDDDGPDDDGPDDGDDNCVQVGPVTVCD